MKKNVKKTIAIILTLVTIMSATSALAYAKDSANMNSPVLPENNITAYSGEAQTPDIVLKNAGTELIYGTDYDLAYENNVEVGMATVIITFKGNYTGERTVNFNIIAKTLDTKDVSFTDIDNQTYTGGEIKPQPTITYNGVTLEKDKDYTLSYENNINTGIGKINVNFIGNYNGTASTTFQINAKTVDESNISISNIPDQAYTGNEIKPEPTVTDTSH